MTSLPVIGTCEECMHSGLLDFGDVCCPRYGFRHGYQEGCENFNKPTGLRWGIDDMGDWFLWLDEDEYVGSVLANRQRDEWGAFWSLPGPDFVGTLHECARALVATVTSKEINQ